MIMQIGEEQICNVESYKYYCEILQGKLLMTLFDAEETKSKQFIFKFHLLKNIAQLGSPCINMELGKLS